jgi:hypothetical protein
MEQVPPKLYKYCSLERPGHVREIIVEGKLYMSSPASFSDPFECRPTFEFAPQPEEVATELRLFEKMLSADGATDEQGRARAQALYEKAREDPHALRALYETDLRTRGVYCLTSRPNSLLMWSHYGGGHRGVCLEFDTRRGNGFFGRAERIHYSRSYPVIKLYRDDRSEIGKTTFMTKSLDWEHEDEWRLLSVQYGHLSYPSEALTGIVLGMKVTEEHEQMIRGWVEERDAGVFSLKRARAHESEYRIGIEPSH